MIGSRARLSLSFWNALAHSSVHSKFFYLLISGKKGLLLSADRDMNLFKVVAIPFSFCTSFGFRGVRKSLIALI